MRKTKTDEYYVERKWNLNKMQGQKKGQDLKIAKTKGHKVQMFITTRKQFSRYQKVGRVGNGIDVI